MRDMPSAMQAAILASETSEVLLMFVTITQADLDTTLYLVNNTKAVTRGGQSYTPIAMSITPPSEDEGEIGNARLAIDAVNSDVSIVEAIRTMTPDTPATVEIVVAIASAPDATPELDLGEFSWRNVEWNKTIASGDLTYDDTLDIVVPGYDCTPENTPGVF